MKPELLQALKHVKFHDWAFRIQYEGERPYLQLHWEGPCAIEGHNCPQSSRKWWLSPHMTPSELVQTCLMAVLVATEHEVREHFTYKGRPIFGPHFNVENLLRICELPLDTRETRDA